MTAVFTLPSSAKAVEIDRSIGKTGRYITWFSDLNPNRKINGDELIYTLSREMYSK